MAFTPYVCLNCKRNLDFSKSRKLEYFYISSTFLIPLYKEFTKINTEKQKPLSLMSEWVCQSYAAETFTNQGLKGT